jgi:hypothetical protein
MYSSCKSKNPQFDTEHIYNFCMSLTINSDYFLNTIFLSIFITDTDSVLCEVGTHGPNFKKQQLIFNSPVAPNLWFETTLRLTINSLCCSLSK